MPKGKPELTAQSLNTTLRKAGDRWKARSTLISQLSETDQNRRLGLKVLKKDRDRIKAALAIEAPGVEFATARDWREKEGKNWVTPIRDQGNCGSCVAFGTVAAIECQARIQYDNPAWDLDLSEADLFFCGAGRKCSEGWWPTYALDYAKQKGIAEEACFKYQDRDMDCNVCDNKPDRMLKIGGWKEIVNVDERKAWLDKKGPLVACMAVYRDFFYYDSGVYVHREGELAGYHAICCVGYNEDEKCWICKNSWGDDWGDNGFFKIEYGQAGIDTEFAMYGAEEISGTLVDGEDKGCAWAEYVVVDHPSDGGSHVLWVYADGKWRHQNLTDAQLAGLGTILFNSDQVQAYYEDTRLTRIKGFKKFS
jgi:C1A family cysteine protease